jgi:hypothetical protein
MTRDEARRVASNIAKLPTLLSANLVLKALKEVLSVLAWAALLGAGIGSGAIFIHWLETGTWVAGKTLGEAWPALAETVAAMKWTGAQPIALWVVAQSLTLVYAALAVVFLLLSLVAERDE